LNKKTATDSPTPLSNSKGGGGKASYIHCHSMKKTEKKSNAMENFFSSAFFQMS
jgi:hypothetical protein